ncbi:MAG: transcriptional regulator [Pelotomaculum sp.]|nr:transcriptional regulator [Pelotomaculum sp.]
MELIKKGEDSQMQFKERFTGPNALAAEICAFANSQGGKILVGVTDQGDITGLSMEEVHRLNQWISNACSQQIDPPVNVLTENILYGERIVVVITVPLGRNKFYMANGRDIWVKVGADKRRARREEIQRLLQESGNLYAEEMPVEESSMLDLDLDFFKEFYQKRAGESIDSLEITLDVLLTNMRLLKDGKCTLAGLLLFGKNPEERRPAFIIKAISFTGNDPAGVLYRDSRDLTGNIARLFLSGMAFLKNNLRMVQGEQGFNSVGCLEIPEVALEEALINAILHRNYFLASNIRLFVFDDRVEIISPGSLPNTLRVETIKHGIHVERNPIMASLVRDIKEIPYRGAGTGIQRIIRACKEAGIRVEFINNEEGEQFKVIFYRDKMV